MSRVNLPRVPVDSGQPGWSFWRLDGRPEAVVVRCAHCKSMGMLTKHSIDLCGEVNASIFCCDAGHIFAVLDDWPSNLRKQAGAMCVEQIA